MRTLPGLLLTIAAALSAPTDVLANASAKVTLTPRGGTPIVLNTSTSTYGAYYLLGSLNLLMGQPIDLYYDYTVSLADDGLPASRTYQYCAGISLPECGPTPTGFELAYAKIVVGLTDGRTPQPSNISVISDAVTFQTQSGATVDSSTYSGVLHVHALNNNPIVGSWSVSPLLYILEYVDAAPIPEPSTYALLLGGLGVVGLASRRRRT